MFAANIRERRRKNPKVCLIHANIDARLCYRLSLLVRGSLRLKAWERFQASCSIGLLPPATRTKVQPRTRSCRGRSPSNTAWPTQSVTFKFHKHPCSVGSLNPDVNEGFISVEKDKDSSRDRFGHHLARPPPDYKQSTVQQGTIFPGVVLLYRVSGILSRHRFHPSLWVCV